MMWLGETKQRQNRSEGKSRRHQKRGVHPFLRLEAEDSGQGKDADELGSHLDREKNDNEPRRGGYSVEIHQRAGFQKIKGGQNRKGDNTHAMWQFWIVEKRRSQRHAYEVRRQ